MILRRIPIFRRLLRDRTALAATEFAMIFPILLTIGLMGLELANRAIVQMKIHQLAVHVADNASRIGDQSMLEDRAIYESDFQDLFYGAELQAGGHLDLYGRGRIVLSSLEVVPDTDDDQYIHWQRCMGAKSYSPRFGVEGDGLTTEFPGMGPPGEEVIAFANEAVMFVEIAYDYDPLIGNPFGMPNTITATSSFTVRDDRDLTRIYQRDPDNPAVVADCSTFGSTSYSGGAGGGSSSSGGGSSSGGSGPLEALIAPGGGGPGGGPGSGGPGGPP